MKSGNEQSKTHPQIGLRLGPKEYADLWLAAGKMYYRKPSGVTEPGRLFRVLVEIAWPLFRRAGFDPHRLAALVNEAASQRGQEMKGWVYDLYKSIPAEKRRDVMRGIADTYNFDPPIPEDKSDEIDGAEDKGKVHATSARARGNR